MCTPGASWTEYHCITASPGSCEATRRKYTQQRTYVCYDGRPVEASGARKFIRCGC
ncbi:hypothetical protein [Streptomyces flaveolus]|uniref:hypothetical protein n=1 Tax=Streptomyces flaveolus TaxID=67297 RepID=UPI0036F86416